MSCSNEVAAVKGLFLIIFRILRFANHVLNISRSNRDIAHPLTRSQTSLHNSERMYILTTLFVYNPDRTVRTGSEKGLNTTMNEINGGLEFPLLDVPPGTTPAYVDMDVYFEDGEPPVDFPMNCFKQTEEGVEEPLTLNIRLISSGEAIDDEESNDNDQDDARARARAMGA